MAQLIEPHVVALGLSDSVARVLSLTFAFGTITLLHIVIGEQAPKYFAIQQSERVVLLCARLMQIFFFATYPFVRVLNAFSNGFLRLVGLDTPGHEHGASTSPEELRLIVQAAFRAGSLEGPQRDLLERVLRGSGRSVRAIMVPRVDMSVLSVEADLDTAEPRMRREGYSRYPLSEQNDPDRIVGYVYTKDVWTAARPLRGGLSACAATSCSCRRRARSPRCWRTFAPPTRPSPSWSTSTAARAAWSRSKTASKRSWETSATRPTTSPSRTVIRPDGSVVVDGSTTVRRSRGRGAARPGRRPRPHGWRADHRAPRPPAATAATGCASASTRPSSRWCAAVVWDVWCFAWPSSSALVAAAARALKAPASPARGWSSSGLAGMPNRSEKRSTPGGKLPCLRRWLHKHGRQHVDRQLGGRLFEAQAIGQARRVRSGCAVIDQRIEHGVRDALDAGPGQCQHLDEGAVQRANQQHATTLFDRRLAARAARPWSAARRRPPS